ncbi:AMP-dependent synthetase and ligase [Nitrospina gracilis 3/211]|uniref:AMP-dependent synthetase and ligase n=1 Tax=Nitrospina gracilis (strain 3/211) TaxID=1266370 RepID=M1Z1P2_NITG3|nr:MULTISPECIES: acyl-[ACP]--phospholipid O-acyltransferase [Nitrospina]MCF8724282.1 acyl-[acyl-carrier-protein]-phospholipid O-acyltransferase/long-chain-fatty-acid--[acyl-carrier-protein] ligase [Nitrospina sp. Nb-3]CCQ91430.1 AMP-dependent synthetase and ligase [Nitrospina gracilis 3/211]
MLKNQLNLLWTRRFLPLFVTQFLGAFNDNLFKNALVILITYVAAEKAGLNAQLMITAAAGIFILPFFLFSATAGQLADKYEKSRLVRIIKFVEILLMIGAGYGFYIESVNLLMIILFLMGTQSAFFGPIKYGILPELLVEDELIGGNALIEAGTFVSILVGTIVGGLLILRDGGVWMVTGLVVMLATVGFVGSLYIPKRQAAAPKLKVDYNFFRETWNIVRYSYQNRDVFLSILGISWFWLIGATFLAQFPTYGKDIIGGNEELVTLFLTVFSVGIGVGSLLCNRLLKGEIVATYVPLGMLGMTVFIIDLYFASQSTFISTDTELIGAGAFLTHFSSWRILFDMLMISLCGGLYIVPLYAILQSRSEITHRSRTIASNNVLNALFMVVSAIGTAIMLKMGFDVTRVFLTLAILNTFVALYTCQLLPDALVKSILIWIFHTLYKVEVKGFENYKKVSNGKFIIIANHLSFLDAALIAAYTPVKLTFAINTYIARSWMVRPFLSLVDTFAMDPTSPIATRGLIEAIRNGARVMIFPEGRITVTGSLMKVYEGPGMIADKSGAPVLPVRINGAQYTPFSRMRGKLPMRWFPKITLTFLEPRTFHVPDEVKGRKRRKLAASQLYRLMSNMLFESSDSRKTLFEALLEACFAHGGGHAVAEDIERKPINYRQLILRSFILGRHIAKGTEPGEYVGVLLPNANGALVTFFGLQAFGRIPAMLNFSVGTKNMLASCDAAKIKTVYTSRLFIEKGKLHDVTDALEKAKINIVYLENLQKEIGLFAKLRGVLSSLFPERAYRKACRGETDPGSPCVVLFTSGSEGVPKGVVLTHANIVSNVNQLNARIDLGPTDIVFNSLPVFHSFGLTGGTLLPALCGLKIFFYPSPLHYRQIPELIYDTNATIMFGTDTFLAGYAHYGHPYDFYNLRYMFAGAEKLKEETRKVWAEKFGIRIFEGYGATETAPILSLNTPMLSKPGTVGCFLPAIEHKLETIPGIDEGGRLWVTGPNVMAGYLRHTNPGVLEPPEGRWYDTGDIVDIDEEGFITIKGRAKRFAKIGGEMISLTAVESYLSILWPDHNHAVVTLPDEKKGEQMVLVTTNKDAARDAIVQHVKANGLGELSIPKKIMVVDEVPLLATGKVDYVTTQELVNTDHGA